MKEQEKGILLEKNGAEIVFTTEGNFCFVQASAAQVGSEVPVKPRLIHWWQTLAAAAAVAFFFIGFGLYRFLVPSPCAYVALDINPSLELGIDRQARVLNTNLLNEDARRLVSGLKLRGIPVTKAIDLLLDRAEELHYLTRGQSGVVMVTVVPVERGVPVPKTSELAEVAASHIHKADLPVKVVASSSASGIRGEARREGLSSGRYALKIGGENSGRTVTIQELKREGLAQFEENKKVSVEQLLKAGNQKGIVVKPVEIKYLHRSKDNGSGAIKPKQDGSDPGRKPTPPGKPKTTVKPRSEGQYRNSAGQTGESSGSRNRFGKEKDETGVSEPADGGNPPAVQSNDLLPQENVVNPGVYDPAETGQHIFTGGEDIIKEMNSSGYGQVYGGMDYTPER
ncbi:MAG: hypothetical protein AB1500_03985 [Bacillota bacterium]